VDNQDGQHSMKSLGTLKVAEIYSDLLPRNALRFYIEMITTQKRIGLALSNNTYSNKAKAFRCNVKIDAFYHTLFYRMVIDPFSQQIRDDEKHLVASGITDKIVEWINYEFIVGPYMKKIFSSKIVFERDEIIQEDLIPMYLFVLVAHGLSISALLVEIINSYSRFVVAF
jgi:hypothetical protein